MSSSSQTAHSAHPDYTASGASHITAPIVYFRTYIVLLLLMFLTMFASFQDYGAANNFIAMAIATTKALMVIAYFMQVKGSTRLTLIWAALGFCWLPFLFCTLVDYLTRSWLPTIGW